MTGHSNVRAAPYGAGVLALLLALHGCAAKQAPGAPPRPVGPVLPPAAGACAVDADCGPSPQPCLAQRCQAGRCQPMARPVGFVPPDPTRGDCKRLECASNGTVVESSDGSDAPATAHECRTMRCGPAGPVEEVGAGQACGTGGACARDGSCATIEQLAFGDRQGCVLLRGGAVRCFGWDEYGQLSGAPATRLQRTAEPAPVAEDAIQVAANEVQSCALRRDGSVTCWGDAGDDRVAAKLGRRGPVVGPIERLGPARLLGAAGHQACALHSEGVISCWGATRKRAVLVGKPRGPVDRLVVGANGVCAMLVDRSLQCFRTRFEQEPSWRSVLPDAAKLHDVAVLSLGRGHACAVLDSGVVECWGMDLNGEVDPHGPGARDMAWRPPTRIEGLPPARSVATALRHSCALLRDGRVVCWGDPNDGEGAGRLRELPVRARAVGLGYEFGCLVDVAGQIQCWGDSGYGASSTHAYKPSQPLWVVAL